MVQLRNATLEDHSVRTGGGAAVVGSAFDAARTGRYAIDYWPTTSVQRTVVVDDNGAIWKDDGSGGGWATLVTGLTTAGTVPFLYEIGLETAGHGAHLKNSRRRGVVYEQRCVGKFV